MDFKAKLYSRKAENPKPFNLYALIKPFPMLYLNNLNSQLKLRWFSC